MNFGALDFIVSPMNSGLHGAAFFMSEELLFFALLVFDIISQKRGSNVDVLFF